MGDESEPAGRPGRPTQRTDELADLFTQVRDGDQAAFAVFYDRTAARVFGLVRRVVRDPSIAEDVTQEVFVEAWRTAARYDAERGSVVAWLLTLAHRRAVDRVRSEQAARDRQDRVGRRDVERPVDDVADEVERSLDRQRVRGALDGLTALQREAVEMAYYRGNTQREVARLLDVPLGTVKTRLRDGLGRLRIQLGVTG